MFKMQYREKWSLRWRMRKWKTKLTTRVETESMFLLSTFLGIPVKQSFFFTGESALRHTDSSVPPASVCPPAASQNNPTVWRSYGPAGSYSPPQCSMKQQTCNTRVRVGARICVWWVHGLRKPHTEAQLWRLLVWLQVDSVASSSKKDLNDCITVWWTVGERASGSYTAFNKQNHSATVYNTLNLN